VQGGPPTRSGRAESPALTPSLLGSVIGAEAGPRNGHSNGVRESLVAAQLRRAIAMADVFTTISLAPGSHSITASCAPVEDGNSTRGCNDDRLSDDQGIGS
jgi:hypothetical protein